MMTFSTKNRVRWAGGATILFLAVFLFPQKTEKPVLHGRHWVAITGKPMAATAGAMIFQKGGNAVDAACAMLGAVCTMWDVLSWGGETQALIYNPNQKKVIAVNGLGVAPSGATAEYFRSRGMSHPPAIGPLSAVTPGTPGGLMTMLAEFGTMSLEEILAPAMRLAEGYPIEKGTADSIEREKDKIKAWPYARAVMLPHEGREHEGPVPGEVFRQDDLLQTLQKLVQAEREARTAGRGRKESIYAAYDRFYKGDIAREFVRGADEQGALFEVDDLARWKVYLEEPVKTTYKGLEVYKLNSWVQGPVMLQALNMLETVDLKKLGYNSAAYIHMLYQVMNLVFADRDFYYGDPYFPPEEPLAGLLSKEYARDRFRLLNPERNDPDIKPGDPYPFQGQVNPFRKILDAWPPDAAQPPIKEADPESFATGTTSIQAADENGWVVSVTPSGGWVPAVIAGRTGIGISQRAQSFVVDENENPFNVIVPGKRPRSTLTPGLVLKNGRPYFSCAVQGGDTQDQNLLQFFLEIVEFGMNVQQACEAPHFTSFQMRNSFDDHQSIPGRLEINEQVPEEVRSALRAMGYRLDVKKYTSGPINAIFFDQEHGTFWGGSSNYGDDYGVVW
ncbi:MAG: gamma-glutamyltransferase [Candidatus Aminicenantes bacterium]|nr:gamma-glutamyltransferase [Candidatus Aminicenantes bacterium]